MKALHIQLQLETFLCRSDSLFPDKLLARLTSCLVFGCYCQPLLVLCRIVEVRIDDNGKSHTFRSLSARIVRTLLLVRATYYGSGCLVLSSKFSVLLMVSLGIFFFWANFCFWHKVTYLRKVYGVCIMENLRRLWVIFSWVFMPALIHRPWYVHTYIFDWLICL